MPDRKHLFNPVWLLLMAAWNAAAVEWSPCAQGPITVSDVQMEPYPPQHGKPMKVSVQGTLDTADAITGGKIEATVFYFGFNVYSSSADLCKEVSCPLASGPVTVVDNQNLPSIAPPGSYAIKLQAVDHQGHSLFCVDIKMHIATVSLRGLGSWWREQLAPAGKMKLQS